ncbi:MAG: PHP domain-containing protein, partial [bacterium]
MFIQQKLYKALFIVSLVFLIIGTGLGLVGETAEINIEINNPYEDVNWENFEQYKSNLHTHTTESDGDSDPAEVIDGYHQLDYSILALTDHNNVTWTWESFDRDPEELGMIAIQANELSDTHHIGSFFNDYDEITSDE